MSFLTEYYDEYRNLPIRRTVMCRPENRWAKLEGKWFDPKTGKAHRTWTDQEKKAFITVTLNSLRGTSTYQNDYCAHLSDESALTRSASLVRRVRDSANSVLAMSASGVDCAIVNHCCMPRLKYYTEFKTRPFVPRVKKPPPCKVEAVVAAESDTAAVPVTEAPKMALRDTELMRLAKQMYEPDKESPTLKPLTTHSRIYGYVRPCLWKTGQSEYQGGIARVAYELVRDNRIPKYEAANGVRPRWGYPPEGTRQPELDGIPLDGERLY